LVELISLSHLGGTRFFKKTFQGSEQSAKAGKGQQIAEKDGGLKKKKNQREFEKREGTDQRAQQTGNKRGPRVRHAH